MDAYTGAKLGVRHPERNTGDPVDARRTSINYASVTFTSSPLALLKMATQ
jgi:hypothetical protein